MLSADEYWSLVADNIVLLLLLVPLLGVVVVACLSSIAQGAVHQVAVANTLMTFALSAAMMANYEPTRTDSSGDPVLYQMTTDVAWSVRPVESPGMHKTETATRPAGGSDRRVPDIRFAVGVDGISLWFVLLTATLMLPAVASLSGGNRQVVWGQYALLLLLETALIGTFVVLDVIGLCICLSAVPLLLFFLIGHWGGYGRRAAAYRLFLFQQAAALLVMLGLIALVVSHAWMTRVPSGSTAELTFSIRELVGDIPTLAAGGGLARQYWSNASPLAFTVFLIGFAMLVPLFPLHGWLTGALDQTPTAVAVLLIGAGTKIGCYGFARFLVPLFPGLLPSAVGLILLACVGGALYAALVALAQRDVLRTTALACVAHQGLCVAALLSLNLVGACGGLLHAVGQGLCFGVLAFLVGALERRRGSITPHDTVPLLLGRWRLGVCLLFVVLAAAGVPGLSGFAGGTLMFLGILRGHPALGPGLGLMFWGLLAVTVLGWVFLLLIRRCFAASSWEPGESSSGSLDEWSRSADDLTSGEIGALLPALLLIVWIGICPDFFLERMEPSVSRTLTAYGTTLVEEPQEDAERNASLRERVSVPNSTEAAR